MIPRAILDYLQREVGVCGMRLTFSDTCAMFQKDGRIVLEVPYDEKPELVRCSVEERLSSTGWYRRADRVRKLEEELSYELKNGGWPEMEGWPEPRWDDGGDFYHGFY